MTQGQDPDRSARRLVLDSLGILGPLLLGLWHVRVVASYYHFGSFDDDAGYVLGAKAIVHGAGLTGTLSDGRPLIGYYPPGFAALLAPVVAVFGSSVTPLRLVATVAFAAIFPLTWWYLGRCGVGRPTRVAVGVLLALNPVLATFGSMVMAETAFVGLFMVWLVLCRRFDGGTRALGPDALGVIVAGAGLVWLKQAAIGMVAGLLLWLVLRRAFAKALAVGGGIVLLLLPVVVARLVVGVPISGARYSQEFGQFYSGGLWQRVFHTVPSGVWSLLNQWFPESLLPDGSPWPSSGWEHVGVDIAGLAVPFLAAVGLVVWWRRYRDPSVAIVVVYLGEVVLYPFINERRTVLFLPVLATWTVLGAVAVGRFLSAGYQRWRSAATPRGALGGALLASVVVVVAVVVPLGRQFHRDYLFAVDQSSSRPDGSPYMTMLQALGAPRDVVETDYVSSVALLGGHRGDDTAFVDSNGTVPGVTPTCDDGREVAALHADHAAYLLTGALNKPMVIDSACLLDLAATSPWAVRLLTTSADAASVFELIGPGTPHPDLVDLTARAALSAPGLGATPLGPQALFDNPGDILTAPTIDGQATLTWRWAQPVTITQVSVGAAQVEGTRQVEVQEQRPDGSWVTVAGASGPVGDGGIVPFLLATSPGGAPAQALRVIMQGTGTAGVVNVRALGPG